MSRDNFPGSAGYSFTTNPVAPLQLSDVSGPSFGSFVHFSSSSSAAPPTSAPLALPPPKASIDKSFDDDVEHLRSIIKGSDLKRKFALISEVWAGEIALAEKCIRGVGGIADMSAITATSTGKSPATAKEVINDAGNSTAAGEEAASDAGPLDGVVMGGLWRDR